MSPMLGKKKKCVLRHVFINLLIYILGSSASPRMKTPGIHVGLLLIFTPNTQCMIFQSFIHYSFMHSVKHTRSITLEDIELVMILM